MSKKYYIDPKNIYNKYEVYDNETFAEAAERIVKDKDYVQLKELNNNLQEKRTGFEDYDLLINLGWIYIEEPEQNEVDTDGTEYSRIACELRQINPDIEIRKIKQGLPEGCNIFESDHDKFIICPKDKVREFIHALILGANAIDEKNIKHTEGKVTDENELL